MSKKLLWIIPCGVVIIIGLIIFFKWMNAPATATFTEAMGWKSSSTAAASSELSKINSSEPTQSELNEKLKVEATQANYSQLITNVNEFKDKKVFAEGTVEAIKTDGWPGGEFSLSTKEVGNYGVYDIFSLDTENHYSVGKDIKTGDKVKVWGNIEGSDNSGAPKIDAIIIEKE